MSVFSPKTWFPALCDCFRHAVFTSKKCKHKGESLDSSLKHLCFTGKSQNINVKTLLKKSRVKKNSQNMCQTIYDKLLDYNI